MLRNLDAASRESEIVIGQDCRFCTISWRSALKRISILSPEAERVASTDAPMKLQSASHEPGSG